MEDADISKLNLGSEEEKEKDGAKSLIQKSKLEETEEFKFQGLAYLCKYYSIDFKLVLNSGILADEQIASRMDSVGLVIKNHNNQYDTWSKSRRRITKDALSDNGPKSNKIIGNFLNGFKAAIESNCTEDKTNRWRYLMSISEKTKSSLTNVLSDIKSTVIMIHNLPTKSKYMEEGPINLSDYETFVGQREFKSWDEAMERLMEEPYPGDSPITKSNLRQIAKCMRDIRGTAMHRVFKSVEFQCIRRKKNSEATRMIIE